LLGANVPDFRGAFLRGAGLNRNGNWGETTRAVNSWQDYKTARPSGATPFGTNLYGAHNHGRNGAPELRGALDRESKRCRHSVQSSNTLTTFLI